MSVDLQLRLNRCLLRSGVKFFALPICVVSLWSVSLRAQTPPSDSTCDSGSGEYRTEFSTGITVDVGPIRKGAFAERACSAKLSRERE